MRRCKALDEILSDIWTSSGGEPSALDALTLTGDEPQLPSSFRVAAAAQVSVAATGLAAAEIWKMRSGEAQDVAVDMRHAVVECRSERYLRVDGKPPPPAWDAIAGVYKTRDGFVRLHTNFPHHRDAVCKVLNCKPERDAVQAALMQWDGEAFETAAYAGGGVVAFMRSHDAMVGHAARQGACRIAADLDRKDRRGRAKALAQGRAAAGWAFACSICRA